MAKELDALNPDHRPKKGDNVTVPLADSERGSNGATYLVRRLKRDAPKIAEALAKGEYPSARAAGIAAGIVKVPTPLELAKRIVAKLSDADEAELLAWLQAKRA